MRSWNELKQEYYKKPRYEKVNYAVGIAAIIIVIVISLIVKGFFSFKNIINILEGVSTIGFMAIGMTYVMVVGGIDLSLPTVVSAAAVVGATYMTNGGSPTFGCIIMLFVSLCFGLINAVAIAYIKLTPFIVTLSTMVLAQGFAVWYTKSQSITGFPSAYTDVVAGKLFNTIPVPIIVLFVFIIISWIILAKTKTGRSMYSVGINEKTSLVSGIPTERIKLFAYLFSSFMAGITAIILTAMMLTATVSMVRDVRLMDIISATVIGGASLNGGSGSIIGTILGVLLIVIIGNCSNLLNISYNISMIIKGTLIVIIIGLDVFRSKE